MEIANSGTQDKLIRISTPVSARVELHSSSHNEGLMKMRAVGQLTIPAHSGIGMKPGTLHLMLIDLKQPLRKGDTIPLSLKFERAGLIVANAVVGDVGTSEPPRAFGQK